MAYIIWQRDLHKQTLVNISKLIVPHHVVPPLYSRVEYCSLKNGAMSDVDVHALGVYFNLTLANTQLLKNTMERWKR